MVHNFSTDPAFHLDLLQLLASFLSGGPEEFEVVESHRFGIEMVEEAPRVFSGGGQATAFVRGFSFHDQLMSDLAMNPLFGRPDIVPLVSAAGTYFSGKGEFRVRISFREDGTILEAPQLLYARMEAPRFVYHALYIPILRICEFQTVLATFRRYPERLKRLSREGDPREPESPALILYGVHGGIASRIKLWTYDLSRVIPNRLMGATHAAWFWQAISTESNEQIKESNKSSNRTTLEGEWDLNSTAVLEWAMRVDDSRLAASGLLRIPLAELPRNSQLSNLLLLGSHDYRAQDNTTSAKGEDSGFVLIDSRYQSLLPVEVDARSVPVYTRNISELPSNSLGPVEFLCARENRVEVVTARNFNELRTAVSRVVLRFNAGRLLFRGQTRHYSVQRDPTVKSWLYGTTDMSELSLQTSASRNAFPYDAFFGRLQLYLQGLLYEGVPLAAFKPVREELGRQVCPFDDDEVWRIYRKWMELYGESSWDLIVMGLAQHYGVPTHGLDLTADLAVAAWFSLHRFFDYDSQGHQFSWYKPLDAWSQNRSTQPVVYVVETDGAVKRKLDLATSELPLPQPLRVERQSAYLHYGGWGLQTNACAEDVRMAVFLEPGFRLSSGLTASHFFPDEDADPFYRKMLLMKRKAIALGLEAGFGHIVEYLNPMDEALYNATNRRDFQVAHGLLDQGAGVNYRDRSGSTNEGLRPLHWASFYGELDLVRRFLEHGSKLEARDGMGRSALVCAAIAEKSEVVKFLLERGAEVAAMNCGGWELIPPPMRSREVLELLRKYGHKG